MIMHAGMMACMMTCMPYSFSASVSASESDKDFFVRLVVIVMFVGVGASASATIPTRPFSMVTAMSAALVLPYLPAWWLALRRCVELLDDLRSPPFGAALLGIFASLTFISFILASNAALWGLVASSSSVTSLRVGLARRARAARL